MKINSSKKIIGIVTLTIAIIILIISTAGISQILVRNQQGQVKKQEEAQVTITSEIKDRLGNGIVNILIKVESDTAIENITLPNEDGTSLTVTTDKLTIAKDLKVEAGKEYPVAVKTIDGKVTNEIIKIEPTTSIMVSVGDFVNYSAGNWTEQDMEKVNNIYIGPNVPFNSHKDSYFRKFSGFALGTSKDRTITPGRNTGGIYETNIYSEGWRILSINSDETITIIHAGTPESYFHWGTRSGGLDITSSIRMLSQTRDWSMYEDSSTDAVNTNYAVAGSAHCITYNEAFNITGSTNATSNNLRNIGCCYYLPSGTGATNGTMAYVNYSGQLNSSIRLGRSSPCC